MNHILTSQWRLSSVPNIIPLTSTLDLTHVCDQPYTLYHILILPSAGIHALTTGYHYVGPLQNITLIAALQKYIACTVGDMNVGYPVRVTLRQEKHILLRVIYHRLYGLP